ncbi:signal recognition particle subunit Sec65p [Diutina catenulata]
MSTKKPVLEDVDDVDNMDMDIAEFDPTLKTAIAPALPKPSVVRSQDQEPPLFPNALNPMAGSQPPAAAPAASAGKKDIVDPSSFTEEERNHFKKFQIIYPCYFDINRSHNEGRRVSLDRAVENPLAKTISDACRALKLPVLLELDKTHPQDFGNPGRVRVMLRDPGTQEWMNPEVKNKRHLFNAIAYYIEKHPTTIDSVGSKSGIAMPAEFQNNFTPEEIPKVKGFRMNTIVPIHSELTMKHPMTKGIYAPEPEAPKAPVAPKQPKKKIMRMRG